jgi:hypothetical protein
MRYIWNYTYTLTPPPPSQSNTLQYTWLMLFCLFQKRRETYQPFDACRACLDVIRQILSRSFPDPHYFGKLNLDLHWSQNSEALEAWIRIFYAISTPSAQVGLKSQHFPAAAQMWLRFLWSEHFWKKNLIVNIFSARRGFFTCSSSVNAYVDYIKAGHRWFMRR